VFKKSIKDKSRRSLRGIRSRGIDLMEKY